MNRFLLALLLVVAPFSANAIEVFACEPEWAALVQELAADNATITTATSAFQDPHMLQAKPSLIAATRRADLVVCTGADLEIGWLPLLLRRSGNQHIQPGNPGYFLAAEFVRRLEIPASVDRSMGDVHPQGNPHVHLRPRNIERVAKALAERLVEIDPANRDSYQANATAFLERWEQATDAWEQRAAPLAGMQLVSHHRSFSYLADWLDLDVVATLEPKPGIPASGAQLARLLEQLTPNPPDAIIRAPFENEKAARWLSERLGSPVVELPFTVGGNPDATDLFALFEETIRLLEEQLK
ncbi:MAG: zinc ABC transporter substrate-binding protein [Woeseiaceae bacterium]